MDLWHRSRAPILADDFEAQWDPKRRRELETERREKFDAALDLGLEESFPGSDPVSVVQPPHSYRDKSEP
jgi:hypothetical protein